MVADDWIERAHYHLQGWGIWKRANGGVVGHGYDSHSTILECGGSKHFDHMVEVEDAKAAWICDRVIDDLQEPHKTAIESRYWLQGVITHNRTPEDVLLRDAQLQFWAKARRWLV